MNTGMEPVSKNRRRLSTIAAVTGSTIIVALAIAFVAVDFNNFYVSPSFIVDTNTVEALEPIRSDPESEPGGPNNGSDSGNNNDGLVDLSDRDKDDSDKDPNSYPEHSLPCLDPNCPIHHGNGHTIPCDDPDCPICNHDSPCGDPDCPICNGHGLPCDDPDCPIHHGNDSDKPPVDISMEIIRFKPNSCEYADPDAANAVLAEYLDAFERYFDAYPDDKIYLVGSIAKTASWYVTETELSQQRADVVRNSLINLGVDENKLVAVGIGVNDPWRNDEWADGYFNEDVAKTNRRVWVIPDQYDDQVKIIFETMDMIEAEREAEMN